MISYLLSQALHVSRNEAVARRVVEHREAPRIAENNEMGLAGVKVTKERLGTGSQLADAREVVDAPSQIRFEKVRPDQEGPAVATDFKVGEEAVDNVRVGGQDIDGVHLGVRFAALLDALDRCVAGGGRLAGWGGVVQLRSLGREQRTGNVVVENVIFLDGVVDDLLGVFIDY